MSATVQKKRGRKAMPHAFNDGVEQKFCGGCRAWLSLSSFASDASNWDGLVSRCRLCIREYDNAYEARRRALGIKPKSRVPDGTKWVRTAAVNGRRVHCRLYNSFDAMHKRCYSPSRWEYEQYGGRGIRVCAEWLHNYEAFRTWSIANGYRKGLTIDRIDSNADYSPANCRWATRAEQTYNRDACYRLTFNGETKLLHEWARDMGLPIEILRVRKRKGWPDEHVLTVPKGGRCPGFTYGKPGRRPRESYGCSSDGAPK